MKNLFSIIILFCVFTISNAQNQSDFLFSNNLSDTLKLKIDYSNTLQSFLGPEVARKMYLLQESYTYVEKGTVIAPGDKTIVRKPDIYYAMKKLYKYYRKGIKKGIVDEAHAEENIIRNVHKCYAMLYEDSSAFEEYLRTLKKPEDIEKAFDRVKLF